MAQQSNEEVVRRYLAAHLAHDDATLGALRDPDWLEEWPQSGERVRGHDNDRAIMDNWPGGTPRPEAAHIVGSEDRWLMTAMNTVHRVVGGGDQWWVDGKTSYPDGSTWFIVVLLQLRAAMVHRETWYFGPPVEAPAWRDAWVEQMG